MLRQQNTTPQTISKWNDRYELYRQNHKQKKSFTKYYLMYDFIWGSRTSKIENRHYFLLRSRGWYRVIVKVKRESSRVLGMINLLSWVELQITHTDTQKHVHINPYIHICICIGRRVYTHNYMYVYPHAHAYTKTYVYKHIHTLYTSIHINMHMYAHTYMCMYLCTQAHLHTTHVCIYFCVHIHICTHRHINTYM